MQCEEPIQGSEFPEMMGCTLKHRVQANPFCKLFCPINKKTSVSTQNPQGTTPHLPTLGNLLVQLPLLYLLASVLLSSTTTRKRRSTIYLVIPWPSQAGT